MAAPATTARSTPMGIPLKDGFSTKIAFSNDPDVEFWEQAVTPPALDKEEGIPLTTMHNTLYRTFFPRSLITVGDISLTVYYDPVVYTRIAALMGAAANQSITVHFPDGSTLDLWGYLRRFEPQQHAEGTAPTANITIHVTNYDSANNVEAAPAMTEVAGT